MALAVVKDLRVARAPAIAEDLEALETDVLTGFVLARAAAGLADSTIAADMSHLEQVRAWFGRPLWELEPSDIDIYFGKVLREVSPEHAGGTGSDDQDVLRLPRASSQGGLCSAAHNDPYAQCWIMRSVDPLRLVRAGQASER
ncbi:hypothetical protein ACTMTI_53570 [Nonomuraea sp. H19]|uniref:hypothetical protein n=1 Tax=Nonomuraea sp. H19 TaxID=3452206 RepID=UPI003F89B2FE